MGGLNIFENAQLFSVAPGAEGKAPIIKPSYPDTPWMSWTVHATTGAASSSNTIYCINSQFGPWGEFHGSFPSDRKSYTVEGSNRFGAWTCAYYFYKFLTDNGISSASSAPKRRRSK